MILSEFIEKLFRNGLEAFRRYYGPYRALVVDNKDPVRQGRILVSCPRARLSEGNGIWVLPMTESGLKHGVFWPPEIGDAVWLFFDNGDPAVPMGYMGGWYSKGDLHDDLSPDSTDSPKKRGFISPGGNKITFDDTSKNELITIEQANGQRILITKDSILVGSKNGAFEPMVKGDTLKQAFDSHTHPHAFGPTGPPTVPLPDEALSKDGKVS